MVYRALRDLGVPYLWGGNDPPGMDCSGAVLRWMEAGDVKIADTTAGELYARFKDVTVPEPGDLAFYGKPGKPATHVVMVLGTDGLAIKVIGASGGGRPRKDETPELYEARMKLRRARVRIESSHLYRHDFMGFKRPPLPTL